MAEKAQRNLHISDTYQPLHKAPKQNSRRSSCITCCCTKRTVQRLRNIKSCFGSRITAGTVVFLATVVLCWSVHEEAKEDRHIADKCPWPAGTGDWTMILVRKCLNQLRPNLALWALASPVLQALNVCMGCIVSCAQTCVGEVEHPTAQGIWNQLTNSNEQQTGVSLVTFSRVASSNRLLSQWLTDCSIEECANIDDACKRVFVNIGGDELCQEITRTQFFEYFESTRRPFRVFILGAPGVGKSTLINKLAGLQEDDVEYCKTAKTVKKCTTELQFISLPKKLFEKALEQNDFNTVELGDLPGCGELVDDRVVIEALREYSGTWNAAIVVDELGGRLGPDTIVTLNMFAMAFKEVSAWENVIYTCSKADEAELKGMNREERLEERVSEVNSRFKEAHDKSLQGCQINHSCCVSSKDTDLEDLVKLLCELIGDAKDLGAVRSEDQMATAPVVIDSQITEVNRAQIKTSAHQRRLLLFGGALFFLLFCVVMALPTYPALYCDRAIHYQPYGFCYAGTIGDNGSVNGTIEGKYTCTFRLHAPNKNMSQPTCDEHCTRATKPASSCISAYEAKSPTSCELKDSLSCSDTSYNSVLCTCKQLHCSDITCPAGYRKPDNPQKEVPNYWRKEKQVEHCCPKNICNCAAGNWEFSQQPCLHDGETWCTKCDQGFKISLGEGIYKDNPPVCCPVNQDVGTVTGSCTFCSCVGGKSGKDCVENGEEDCDSCREGFHHVDTLQGRCLACSCPHGNPGNDCVAEGGHDCQSCNDGYHLQDGFCISCTCPRGTPGNGCTVDRGLWCASCDDDDYFIRNGSDGQCIHCVCPHGHAGTGCTDDGGIYCTRCIGTHFLADNYCKCCTCPHGVPGTDCSADGGLDCASCFSDFSMVSGECTKRCKCPNGVPGNDCDEEFGLDCASCDSGYHVHSSGCISCRCHHGTPSNDCNDDGEEDCASCQTGYHLYDSECISCACPNGIPSNDCTEDGEVDCESCDSGYHKNYADHCISCSCSGGEAGEDCDDEGESDCVSCFSGYTKHFSRCTCDNIVFPCS